MTNCFLLLLISFCAFTVVKAQTTSECGVTVSCFRHPRNCVDAGCTFIYQWSGDNQRTHFKLAGKIPGVSASSNHYLAIGFGNGEQMGDTGVAVCKTSGAVHSMYNPLPSHTPPRFLDNNNRNVGISDTSVTISGSWLVCEFNRDNQNSLVADYFDLNAKSYHILASFGIFNVTTQLLRYHGANRNVSSEVYTFNQFSYQVGCNA